MLGGERRAGSVDALGRSRLIGSPDPRPTRAEIMGTPLAVARLLCNSDRRIHFRFRRTSSAPRAVRRGSPRLQLLRESLGLARVAMVTSRRDSCLLYTSPSPRDS